jgi:hypothetical protein
MSIGVSAPERPVGVAEAVTITIVGAAVEEGDAIATVGTVVVERGMGEPAGRGDAGPREAGERFPGDRRGSSA